MTGSFLLMSAMVKPENNLNTFKEICQTSKQIEFSTIAACCYNSQYGKLLPDAFYIHLSALHTLDVQLQQYESLARSVAPQAELATIVKFSTNKPKVSYLFYPDFDTDPH
ncbi:MAG: hypothetical protein RLZZ176_3260, partial [Cyanobacteriota bacterium]